MAKKTILIIDDDVVIRQAVYNILYGQYNVLMAKNGYEGVETALQYNVDLILLDILMPGMNGFSALTLLKNEEKTRNVPVMMLTSVRDTKKVIRAKQDGAVGYILKPLKPKELVRRVEAILESSGGSST
ncbi:MAG: response regulator [bacterium]